RVSHPRAPRRGIGRSPVELVASPRALSALVRAPSPVGAAAARAPSVPLRPLGGDAVVILFVNPRATRPANRRFPLSVMAIGAALPEAVDWHIVDGNRPDVDVFAELTGRIEAAAGGPDPVQAVAFSVMPGPQLVS